MKKEMQSKRKNKTADAKARLTKPADTKSKNQT